MIDTPEQAHAALAAGAYAVVVGSAITRPVTIARRFADTIATLEAGEGHP
jgi:N-acylglucosamine-6-phosphate 2-epimerase